MAAHEQQCHPVEREKFPKYDSEELENVSPTLTHYSNPIGDVEFVTEGGDFETRVERDMLESAGQDGIHYKTMSWWHVGMLMIAETVSLGILSLPSAVARLGLIPGLALIPILGLLATYAGYVIGQFKLAHPSVLNFADAGEIVLGFWGFGAIGRELFGTAAILSFIFIQAAHILTFSVMMNVLTDHATCSIIFGVIGTVISIALTMGRKLQGVAYGSVVSFISIVAAIILVMVDVGKNNKIAAKIDLVAENASFTPVFIGILDIMLAYSGNAAFFGFVAELKDPRQFPKALWLLQGFAIMTYTVVAAIIYIYVGRNVDSPALGAASPTIRKWAYGVAIATIVVAGVINGHVAAKQLYVKYWKFMQRPEVVTQRSREAYLSWVVIVVICWFVAWLLAEAIPVFNELLGLVSALFLSWFTYGLSPLLWLHLNRGEWFKGTWKTTLAVLNICMFIIALGSCALGLYASGVEIQKAAKHLGGAFSCANNDPRSHLS